MIITAALVWWNERPEDLDRCMQGIANVADRVVAVDGSYARYPGATVRSDPVQADTLVQAADELNLELDLVIPDRLWNGQVEKRDFTMKRAAEGSDWIAVVDADWVIYADRRVVRRALAGYGPHIDVIRVPFWTPKGPAQAVSGWHEHLEDRSIHLAHLFRVLPEIEVRDVHWKYGARKDGEPVWMWGADMTRRTLPTYPMASRAKYRIEHRCFWRTPEQVKASRAFLNDREQVVAKTGQEDDRPGLKRPVFNYDRVPFRVDRTASRRRGRPVVVR